ncbi:MULTISPECIES: hypothetical protein [unclassified Candidatus Tisiphia]|uniref:hypothetical protein n=1 Tax=unclassified Candidatus Tisiphia TaxID=2996318 RepID=UPI00312C8029
MQNSDNSTSERYPELIEMLLSGKINDFQERLMSFISQLPDNKRSVNKQGFFPLFCLGGFLVLPDTALGEKLGVKEIYLRVEKAGSVKVVKLAISIKELSKPPEKLIFIAFSDHQPPIQFTKGEIDHVNTVLHHLSKKVYSVVIDYPQEVKVEKVQYNDYYQRIPNAKVDNTPFCIKTRERKNIDSLIYKLAVTEKEKVRDAAETILQYFSNKVSTYLTQINFTKEYEYHALVSGFFVMLFKYTHNLKCYLELALSEGFADIVVLVRSPERLPNAIPIIIELKKGGQDILQKDKDQAKKYAEAFWYGPQRMITNNKDIVYSVLNCDLNKDNRLWIQAETKNIDHQPFLQLALQTIDETKIKEQLKYIYYAIPNEASDYYSYTVKALLGQSMLVRTKNELWERHMFEHGEETERISRKKPIKWHVLEDIATFGFVNYKKNKLVLFNIIKDNADEKILATIKDKKVNIENLVGENKNIKINEINLNLKKEKANKGHFEDWCRNVKVNSYDNLDAYNISKTEDFSGQFIRLDVDINKLKSILADVVAVRQTTIHAEDVEHYLELFKNISPDLFKFKKLFNYEIDFQAVLQGLLTYYSDSQFYGANGSGTRVSIIPEMQSGGGARIDIGIAEKDGFIAIELKFDKDTTANILSAKAHEAEEQLKRYKQQPNNIKSVIDSETAAIIWAVFHKTADALIEVRNKFDIFPVVHSSMHIIPNV